MSRSVSADQHVNRRLSLSAVRASRACQIIAGWSSQARPPAAFFSPRNRAWKSESSHVNCYDSRGSRWPLSSIARRAQSDPGHHWKMVTGILAVLGAGDDLGRVRFHRPARQNPIDPGIPGGWAAKVMKRIHDVAPAFASGGPGVAKTFLVDQD